jgi:hypothetical protein
MSKRMFAKQEVSSVFRLSFLFRLFRFLLLLVSIFLN